MERKSINKSINHTAHTCSLKTDRIPGLSVWHMRSVKNEYCFPLYPPSTQHPRPHSAQICMWVADGNVSKIPNNRWTAMFEPDKPKDWSADETMKKVRAESKKESTSPDKIRTGAKRSRHASCAWAHRISWINLHIILLCRVAFIQALLTRQYDLRMRRELVYSNRQKHHETIKGESNQLLVRQNQTSY